MVSRLTLQQLRQRSAHHWHDTLEQWFTYGTIGGSSTIIDFGLFNLLLLAFAPRQPWLVMLLSFGSALVSSVNSYFGHRRWTFKTRAPLGSFLLLQVATLALNTLLIVVLTAALPHMLTLSVSSIANLSKVFAVAGSGIAGFLGNKYWVFRR